MSEDFFELELPDGTILDSIPNGTTKQQIYDFLGNEGYDTSLLDPYMPKAPSFLESIGQGVDILQRDFGSLLNSVGHSLDWDELKAAGVKIRDRNIAEIESKDFVEPDWRDVFNEEGISAKTGAALDFLVHQVGVNLPQILGMAAGGVGGGIAGASWAARGGLATAAALDKAGKVGAIAGATGIGTGVFTAANASRRTEEGLEPNLAKEFGYALPQAAAETAFLGVISKTGLTAPMKAFLKNVPEGMTKTILGKTGEGIAVNIPSEVAQQAMERAAAELDITTPEAMEEYKDAIAGAIAVGGGIGATVGTVKGVKDRIQGKELPKLPELGKKEEPLIEEKDISDEPILPSSPATAEAAVDPLDLPTLEAPEFTEVAVDGKGYKALDSFDAKTQEEIVALRTQSPLHMKGNYSNPISINEALYLYPKGIPDTILKTLVPQRPSRALTTSKTAVDLVIDRINKNVKEVMTRDEWVDLIDKNPFGRGKLQVPWKAQLNKRLPKSLNVLHKDDVRQVLQGIRQNVGINDKDVNPTAYPDEKLIKPLLKKDGTLKKTSSLPSKTAMARNDFKLDKMETKRVPSYSKEYGLAQVAKSIEEPTILDNKTLNFKLGEIPVNAKNLDILEKSFRRMKEVIGKQSTVFVNNVFNNLKESKKSLEEAGRFVGINAMVKIGLNIARANKKSQQWVTDNPLYLEEFWNFIKDGTDFITEQDLARLDKDFDTMVREVAKQGVINDFDLQNAGKEELFSYVFAEYVKNKMDATKPDMIVGPSAKVVFDRAYTLLSRLGQALKGQGIEDSTEIFNIADENFLDALQDMREARMKQRYESEMNKRISEDLVADVEMKKSQAKNPQWKRDRSVIPEIFSYLFQWKTAAGVAKTFPEVSRLVTHFARKEAAFAEHLHENVKKLSPMIEKRPTIFNKAMEIMDLGRTSGQKIEIDEANRRVVFKRGDKRVAISDPQFFEDFKRIQEVFDTDLKLHEENLRDTLGHYGLDYDSDVKQVDGEVDRLERMIKNEKDDVLLKAMKEDKAELQNIASQFRVLNRLNKTQYIPRMRFGDYVIWVWEKGEDGDNLVYQGQYEASDNPLKKYNEEQRNKILAEIEKEGYTKDKSRYKIVGVDKLQNVTYNDLVRGLPNSRVTMETIYSLLGGNQVDNYMKLMENELSDEQKETLAKYKNDTSEAASEKRAEILRRAKIKSMSRVLVDSENIKGYSKDWARVMNAYVVGTAKKRTELQFHDEQGLMEEYLNGLKKDGDLPKKVMEWAKRYYEYNTSPSEDFLKLRALNFMWTMGGNPSSALIQFMNGPMAVVPAIMQWDGNLIRSNARWAKNMGFMINNFIFRDYDVKTGHTGSYGDVNIHNKLIKQGKLHQKTSDVILQAYKLGHIDSMIAQEFTGRVETSKAERAGVKKAMTNFSKFSGSLIQNAEQGGRFVSLKTIVDSFLNEDGSINQDKLKMALNKYKDDYGFVEWQQQNTNMDILTALSTFVLLETHGMYDKSGRGTLQRGFYGAGLTPFMTHPTTQLQLLADLALRRGGEGKKGAAYMLGTYLIFGGLMAMPAAELLKAFYDTLEELYSGSKDDAMLDLQQFMVEVIGINPKIAQAITKGPVRAFTQADVSQRMTMPLPFQSPLLYMLDMIRGNNSDVSRLLGPSIGVAEGVARTIQQRNPSEMLPVAMKNAMKGLIYYRPDDSLFGNGRGAMTRAGNRLVAAEDFTTSERLMKTLGFGLSKESNARDLMYSMLLGDTGFRATQSRFTKQIAMEKERGRKARKAGNIEKAERHFAEATRLRKELVRFLKSEGIPMTKDKYRGIYNSVNDRTKQLDGKNPYSSKMMKAREKSLEKVFNP